MSALEFLWTFVYGASLLTIAFGVMLLWRWWSDRK